jgi:hypothetical protein
VIVARWGGIELCERRQQQRHRHAADIQRSWARTDQDRSQPRGELSVSASVRPDRTWLRDGAPEPRARRLAVEIFTFQSGSPIGITMSNATLNSGNRPDVSGDACRARGSDRHRGSTRRSSSPAANTSGTPRNGVLDGRAVNLMHHREAVHDRADG